MLDFRTIGIPFAGGVETSVDPKIVPEGSLLALENGVFRKDGEIAKRYGTQSLTGTILGGSTNISSAQALAKFDSELNLFSGNSLFTRSASNNGWASRGSITSLGVSHTEVFANTYAQTKLDLAYNQGLYMYAWKDGRGQVRCTVADSTTGALLLSDTIVEASGDNPRCLAIGSSLWVFYNVTNNLKGRRVQISNPTTLTSATTLKTDQNSTEAWFDIVPFGTNRAVVAYHKSDNTIHLFFINESGTVTPFGSPAEVTISERAHNCLTVVNLDDMYVFAAWHNTTNGVRCRGFDNNFNALFAITTLDSDTANYVNITGAKSATNTLTFFYELDQATTYNERVKTNTVTTAGATGTTAVFLRSVGLLTKAFVHSDVVYVGLVFESTLQPTHFLANSSGSIVARFHYGTAGGLQDQHLSNVPNTSGEVFSFTDTVKSRIVTEDNTVYYQTAVVRTDVDFSASTNYQGVELGRNLHINGGILWDYDGANIVEHGFHVYPEGASGAQGAGGSMADGTYGFAVIFQWQDAKNQVHRSSPYYFTQTITAGGGTAKTTVTSPTLRLTGKQNVIIHIFRTVSNGSIYYRRTSASSPLFNSTTVDTVTFDDTAADANILTGEILYTVSGELENDAPPSSSRVHLHNNRLWLVSDDPLVLWYSKEHVSGRGVEFHAGFTKKIHPDGGAVTGLASVDDKLIVFKRSQIRVVTGDGPTALGLNDDLSPDYLISTDTGCTEPESIIEFSGSRYDGQNIGGVMFKGDKGIYLLDRSLTVQFIGDAVVDYNDLEITSASLMSGENEIRFTTESGVCLVYNYYYHRWSVFTNYEAIDSVVYNDAFYFADAEGSVRKEIQTAFTDDADFVRLYIQTAWIKLAGLQGFQRVRRASFLGSYKSTHALQIDMAYDYQDVNTHTIYWDPSGAINTTTFGGDSPYGSGTPYGGDSDNIYQFRIHMPRQKCQSVRFTISDVPTGTYGESLSLNQLSLEVGTMGGINRMRAAKSV